MLHELIYASVATRPMSGEDLASLLAVCHENNASLDVTGMLVYHDGRFLQLLEGERSAVTALFARIASDPRHASVHRLFEGAIERRGFASWRMAFADTAEVDPAALRGWSDFLDSGFASDAAAGAPSIAHDLLLFLRDRVLGEAR